jgi:peptidoglycan L-alanyl-D-glutamate endopeptidase CwlK
MSNQLIDLERTTCDRFQQLMAACREEGIILVVCQTWRSFEEQALLYQKGRSRPGPIVTNARPGSSFHNYGRAVYCAFRVKGKLSWRGPWTRY